MAHFTARAEKIPGLITVGWIFKGTTMDEKTISLAWLEDGEATAMVDVTRGLADAAQTEGLTVRMRSFLSGLAEIGGYFRRRKTVDEPDVTEDDIENAAIVFAFPRVAMNPEARALLKKHLDLLQDKGVLDRLTFRPNLVEDAAAPEAAAESPDAGAGAEPFEPSEPEAVAAAGMAAETDMAEDTVEDAADASAGAEMAEAADDSATEDATRAGEAGSDDAGFPEASGDAPAEDAAPEQATAEAEAAQDAASGDAGAQPETDSPAGDETAETIQAEGAAPSGDGDADADGETKSDSTTETPAADTLILTETSKIATAPVQPEPEKKRRSFFERL